MEYRIRHSGQASSAGDQMVFGAQSFAATRTSLSFTTSEWPQSHHRHSQYRPRPCFRRMPHMAVRHRRAGARGCAAAVARHELQERPRRAAFGGGKSVIIADPKVGKSKPARMHLVAPSQVSAADTSPPRMSGSRKRISRYSPGTRVTSADASSAAGAGGNPAPKTAFGVYLAMRAAIELKLDRSDFKG